jgi:hypothetical protein
MSQDNLLGALGGAPRNVKHLIDDAEQSVEGRLDSVPPVDGDVPMQDLLQDLGVGDQALAVIDQLLEPSLCVALVGVRRAHGHERLSAIKIGGLSAAATPWPPLVMALPTD